MIFVVTFKKLFACKRRKFLNGVFCIAFGSVDAATDSRSSERQNSDLFQGVQYRFLCLFESESPRRYFCGKFHGRGVLKMRSAHFDYSVVFLFKFFESQAKRVDAADKFF